MHYANDMTVIVKNANDLQILVMEVKEHNENRTKIEYKEGKTSGNKYNYLLELAYCRASAF